MAQAGSTPPPDVQMASSANPNPKTTTTVSESTATLETGNRDTTEEPSPSAPAEERSNEKLSQITNFANKYNLQINPNTVSPDTLELDNLDLDFIQVAVPAPEMILKDKNGDWFSMDYALEVQTREHQKAIKLARQGIIREELRAILRSPDFVYANSNPDNLVPVSNPPTQGITDEKEEPAAQLVPTPQEPPNDYLNPRFPNSLPKDFERAKFINLFTKYPILVLASADDYLDSINARVTALRAFRQKHIDYNRDIRAPATDKIHGSELTLRNSIIKLNNAYITTADLNLHFLKELRTQYDDKPKKQSKKKSKKQSQTQTPRQTVSHPVTDVPSVNRQPRNRNNRHLSRRRQRVADPTNGNFPINQPNNNNGENLDAAAPAASQSKPVIDPMAQAQEKEFAEHKEKYAGVAGKDSARRTSLLRAAVRSRQERRSVCIVYSLLFSCFFAHLVFMVHFFIPHCFSPIFPFFGIVCNFYFLCFLDSFFFVFFRVFQTAHLCFCPVFVALC